MYDLCHQELKVREQSDTQAKKKNIGEYLSVSTPKAHKYFYILTCILAKKKKKRVLLM